MCGCCRRGLPIPLWPPHLLYTTYIVHKTELSRAVGVRRGGGGGGQFGGGYNRGFAGGGGMGYYRSPFSMWFSPFDLFYYWSPRYPARQRERLERGHAQQQALGYTRPKRLSCFVGSRIRASCEDLWLLITVSAVARPGSGMGMS